MSLIACCNGQQVLRSTCGTPRKRQSKCRETCGTPRKRQSKYRETCGTPRKRQSKYRETCGTPANAKVNTGRLVGLPQTPKQMPRDLRDSRKRQSKCRETCGTPRKRPKVLRGTCNSVVGISKSTLAIAWILRIDSLLALFLHRTHVTIQSAATCNGDCTIQSAEEVCGG